MSNSEAGAEDPQALLERAIHQLATKAGSYLDNDPQARQAFSILLQQFAGSIADGTMGTRAQEKVMEIVEKVLDEKPA